MKKSILEIGKALSKGQQRAINGGIGGSCPSSCTTDEDCNPNPGQLDGCIYACIQFMGGVCVYDTQSCPDC